MKKLLLALIMCAFASTMFAQWHRMPPRRPVYNNYGMVQQQRRVVMRQPRVYMRRQGMVRMNFGPVYYGGGWGVNVVFLRQPRVYIQQPRIVYARTPRCQAEAGILEYMINKGDYVILVDQQFQQPDSVKTDSTVVNKKETVK